MFHYTITRLFWFLYYLRGREHKYCYLLRVMYEKKSEEISGGIGRSPNLVHSNCWEKLRNTRGVTWMITLPFHWEQIASRMVLHLETEQTTSLHTGLFDHVRFRCTLHNGYEAKLLCQKPLRHYKDLNTQIKSRWTHYKNVIM